MSIIKKIVFSFGLMLLSIIVMALTNYYSSNKMTSMVDQVAHQSTPTLLAIIPLQRQMQESYQLLSQYIARKNTSERHALKAELQNNEQAFFHSLSVLDSLVSSGIPIVLENNFNQVAQSYYESIRAVINLHDQLLVLEDKLVILTHQFVKLEDTFTWLKDELQSDAGASPLTQNKIEFVISAVEQTVKALRRLESIDDLDSYRARVEKEIAQSIERASTLNISIKTRKTFIDNLEMLMAFAVEKNGLIDTRINQRQTNIELVAITNNAVLLSKESMSNIEVIIDSAQNFVLDVTNDADSFSHNAMVAIISLSVFSIVFTCLLCVTITRSINSPLQLVSSALANLSSGNMLVRTGYRSNNEFGIISRAVDRLASVTGDTLQAISTNSERLQVEASNTASSSDKTLHLVAEQKTRTDAVATAASELEISAGEISRLTQLSLSEVGSMNEATSQGQEEVLRNRNVTHQLHERIENVANECEQLVKSTEDIGSILEVIRTIAAQTNLLALNAAIEAARAGEQGKGFAVVADEVRQLATRSHESTGKIEEMIVALQSTSEMISHAMKECLNHTSVCVEQTQLTDAAFQEISSHVTEVFTQFNLVAQAALEQITVSSDIAKNINIISGGASGTESEARLSAVSSERLNVLSLEQQKLIGQFRF